MSVFINPNQAPGDGETNYSKPNSVPYLPRGNYEIIKDEQVVASFPTLEQAQGFICPGSYIKRPDKRALMTPDEIALAESIARNWGKVGPF